MKPIKWEIKLGISLIVFSIIVYSIKFLILGDPQNTFFYIFNALGFLPINVLLVTLILNKLLNIRSKRDRLQKLNMVIGMFFSEMGTELLNYFSNKDPNINQIRGYLLVSERWSDEEFSSVEARLNSYSYEIDISRIDLSELSSRLNHKKDFLLRLLENPALLEHESFTELLRAIFHLSEELALRKDWEHLPNSDIRHLASDINRAYTNMAVQWLAYMQYLNRNYPYLFSLALRTNPFDENASPIVA